MGDVSKNFNRSEFACKCGCGQDTIDAETVGFCQAVRDHFKQPVTIHSGNRCPAYNTKVGGAKNSQHLRGRAADMSVKDHPPSAVHDFLETLNPGGLGAYSTFTHVDSREGKARWG